MATTISGKLINGIGEPIKNCKITLKSISTSTTVIAHTTASQTPSAAGDYSLSVEPGKYKVTLCVDGFPPEYVGDIQVYKDSPNGTLNYFLGLPQDDDLRPDAIKHFEAMVDKVASQVAEVEKSKLAAEGSARSAAASADRASQITGLSTVTDAISMASVPLPDVWIPLNDGLQMLAGYGEEVKVGAVTVAKMVKHSRSTTAYYVDKGNNLKIANINEARFEKNGLLNEGQSTNLIVKSEDWLFFSHTPGGATEKKAEIITPLGTTGLVKSCISNLNSMNVSLIGDMPYLPSGASSFSFFFKIINANSGFFVYTNPSTANKIKINADGSLSNETPLLFKANIFKMKNGWFRLCGVFPPDSNRLSINLGMQGDEIAFWGIQVEPSSEATSYIATNGTQVTRGQDIPTIPYDKNACDDMSVAVEITAGAYIPPYSNWVIDFASNSNNERYAIVYNNSGQVFAYGFGLGAAVVDGFNLNQRSVVVAVWRASDKQISIYLNGKRGKVANGTQPPVIASHGLIRLMRTYDDVASNGNVRNLRIWHKALTEEQARAIR